MFIRLRTLKLFWEYATDTKIQYCSFLNSSTLSFVNTYMQKFTKFFYVMNIYFSSAPSSVCKNIKVRNPHIYSNTKPLFRIMHSDICLKNLLLSEHIYLSELTSLHQHISKLPPTSLPVTWIPMAFLFALFEKYIKEYRKHSENAVNYPRKQNPILRK